MVKSLVLSESIQLASIIFNRLMDLKDEMQNNLKAVLRIEGVETVEELKNQELYNLAFDLEAKSKELADKAEQLADFIAELNTLDLSNV